jgi:hypothetical protein
MKYLKFLESWYSDYVYDFTDRGFKIKSDSNSNNLNKVFSGKFKGKYNIIELSDEFTGMISKISDDYEILRFKNYFNSATGNASFEVEVTDRFRHNYYIEIYLNGEKQKYFPIRVESINNRKSMSRKWSNTYSIVIVGKLESGLNRNLSIIRDIKISENNKESIDKYSEIKLFLTGSSNKILSIDSDNINKIFNIIDSGKINTDRVDGLSIYEMAKKIFKK